jgi:hypothetical protein
MLFTVASIGGFLSVVWFSQTQVFYSNSWGGRGGDLALCLYTKTSILISIVRVYLFLCLFFLMSKKLFCIYPVSQYRIELV